GQPCGNGLEPLDTPLNSAGKKILPYVTTGNDEIIIYALRSADATKNNQTVSFYVDASVPRAAYPNSVSPVSPTAGQEIKVSISDVDTTNANPPYTLY